MRHTLANPRLVATLTLFVLALISFSTGSKPPDRSTFYVSPGGDDSWPGTKERPWRSPGTACRRMSSGDTLYLLPGRYPMRRFGSDILRPPSGTPEIWTTIKGSAGKSRAVLSGGDNLATAIDIAGTAYVRIENLEIASDNSVAGTKRWFRDGISATGDTASNIVLRDLHIHHLDEFGVNLQDIDGLEIFSCCIEFCGFGAVGGPEGEDGGWRNVVIDDCRLSHSGHYYRDGDGSNRPYDRPDGVGLEQSAGPVQITETVAEHNRGDDIDLKTANATVSRCVVANNSCDGVKLWGDGSRIENTLIYGTGDGVGGDSPWAGIVIGTEVSGAAFEIVNVTVHDNPSRRAYPIYVQYDDRDVPISLIIRNCIIAGGHGAAFFGPSVSLTAEHNLFYRPNDAIQVEANDSTYGRKQLNALGPGNIYGDPRFIRPGWGVPGDYQLRKGSPAIDAGSSQHSQIIDIDGGSRPAGHGVEIGAYERPKGTRRLRHPGGLSAVFSGKAVKLRWKDRSKNETGFVIERRAQGETAWQRLGMTDAGTESFTDKTASPVKVYSYRIFAVAGNRYSRYSGEAQAGLSDLRLRAARR